MRVLFADDDVIARTLMAAVLADLDHDVSMEENGEAAWEAFQRDPTPLVVLDINMPGLDGLEVCRRIRQHEAGRDVFVLIVTARDGRDDLARVLEAGADDYVTKPTSPENLRARLEIAKRRIAQDLVRRTAEAELARSRWLAGIGETTIALEHEINNPLSALLGHAELMMMDDGLNEEQQEQLRIIQEQAARIAQVVRRLAKLKNPQSVEYLAGALMLDLSSRTTKSE
ncbi:MAG: response regulator receiver sensor signal transduction histidine kinase [Gemmatimonadetes bacterium]|jgi:DNA-binding response OmpR family regulator|nr:response regulator receiver sensor signal transduction histidine kinase [Gemmatimonadota bacterium]